MKKAVIYARFSSDRQTEDSIQAQVRACMEYAERKDITVVGTYTDEAVSGRANKTELRKNYKRMLQDARAGAFDVILIHKFDRVARSLREHVRLDEELEKCCVQLIAVAQEILSTKEGKITRSLMWSMSEYYSDNLAEETRKGHKETALKGLHNGGYAPFGYDVKDQQYIINDFEAGYVRKMFDCALNREGFKSLIEEMQHCGVKGKRGKEIKYPQIYSILRNERYTGVYLYSLVEESTRDARRSKPNAIRIEDAFPAIIDKTTFERVQEIMTERKQSGRNRTEYLCSGLVRCGSCGAVMHGFTSNRKGHQYKYYKCSAVCGAPMIRMDDVDAAAIAYLQDLLSDSTQEKIAAAMINYGKHYKDFEKSFLEATKKQIEQKEKEYNNLMQNLSAGVLEPEAVADIGQHMKKLKEEIAELKEAKPPEDNSVNTVKEWLSNIKAAPDDKAVHLLIETITAPTDENKTSFKIESTLKPVLENYIAGERNIDFLKEQLPILFCYNNASSIGSEH
ncbi:MAG: recombinase family protein [Erysipelotrichaceae bacterium]|nr:recombinase family protein [Erysipelotrichaceae bacterium]